MVQRRRIAQTASPRGTLVERAHESLASFADRLGALIYSSDWRGEMLDELARLPPGRLAAGSDAECAAFVRDQVLSGLRDNILTAILSVVSKPFITARNALSDEDFDTATDNEMAYAIERAAEDDPLLYDDGARKLRWFAVDTGFWASMPDPDIDWSGSTITIPTEILRDQSAKVRQERPVSLDFDVPLQAVRVPIHIRQPDRALRRVFAYADVPDEDWLRRYKVYRTEGRLEALAAAWRYLAVAAQDGAMPNAAELGRVMEDYLEAQGFNTSRSPDGVKARSSGLQDMAARVLQQLESQNLSTSVLVPGNPRRR